MLRHTVKSQVVNCLVSRTPKHFQTVYEGEIWCLCTVPFDPKSSKLNSRPVYCLQLYGSYKHYLISCISLFFHDSVIGGSTIGYLRDHCANNVYKLRRHLKFPTVIKNKDRDILVIGLKGMINIKSTEMPCQSEPKTPNIEVRK